MPHFVTSAQGKAHVTSANAAHLTAGLLGNGCYVLPIGQKLACTMTDSNTLRVLFGVASVCGRQWEIEGDYEEVNIDNGVPGYNRVDLMVCRIETAPQETIELKVYKGDETTGTPVVPGHVEGDLNDGDTVCEMPICSVRVNGINPQAPEMLAKESIDIMALLQELRDYKSQAASESSSLSSRITTAQSAADTAKETASAALAISRIDAGSANVTSIPAKSYKDVAVIYNKTFAKPPFVQVSFQTLSTDSNFPSLYEMVVRDHKITGCTVRVFNNASSAMGASFTWLAVLLS